MKMLAPITPMNSRLLSDGDVALKGGSRHVQHVKAKTERLTSGPNLEAARLLLFHPLGVLMRSHKDVVANGRPRQGSDGG